LLSTPLFYLSLLIGEVVWFIPKFYVSLFDFYFSWYYTLEPFSQLGDADSNASASNLAWLNSYDLSSSSFDIQFILLETFFITLFSFIQRYIKQFIIFEYKRFFVHHYFFKHI
jgi:hypothetical protein